MNMTNAAMITLLRIREWGACSNGRDWFREKFPNGGDYGTVMTSLHASRRFEDAQWLADKAFSEATNVTAFVQSEITAVQSATKDKDERGDSARIGSSGDSAQIGSSGYSARIGSGGDYARIKCDGENSVVASAALHTTVTLGEGGCAALSWHDGNRNRFTNLYVGENGIEAGVAYRLDDAGQPVRVNEGEAA